MRIDNPKTGEFVTTPCKGCLCHDQAVQFGELNNGCCRECGCPKNLEGFEHYKKKVII